MFKAMDVKYSTCCVRCLVIDSYLGTLVSEQGLTFGSASTRPEYPLGWFRNDDFPRRLTHSFTIPKHDSNYIIFILFIPISFDTFPRGRPKPTLFHVSPSSTHTRISTTHSGWL